ncbi:hypothetical protein RIR_jg28366.t1 [Rhizophagus irregularis DAOM 181602=DAOM 197198]|uniref:Uncharacterized protein n=1 Tax=Rhizophagus irregularis (strain DAOM 181602 / DAOM 197198 / MUCL 43194) TaxID=747089 RepID=U9UGW1_RHIID|nr:hypothetical protein RIR_jg28366.t1 [Rhizophagus irregularis DAOM 181602=DAOM 197198]
MSTGQQHTHRNSAVLRVKATRSKMISFLLVLDVKCTLSLGMGRTNLSGDKSQLDLSILCVYVYSTQGYKVIDELLLKWSESTSPALFEYRDKLQIELHNLNGDFGPLWDLVNYDVNRVAYF